jgi:hypothetical protein
MPIKLSDMTSQTGSTYKGNLDTNSAAYAGIAGKRRNINGDGRVQQRGTASVNNVWQYCQDMWEVWESVAANGSGTFGQQSNTNFPAGVSIGTANLSTTGVVTVALRTKMVSKNVADLLSAPFIYPVSAPAHPFASLGLLAFQDSGVSVNVTPVLRSADAVDNFSAMTNSLTGAAQSLPSGAVTQLWWDTAANAFQLDSLTNARNGLCLELQFAMPTGLSNKNLQLGDVQFEGGQVASYYGRNPFGDELALCEGFFAKTFPLATPPGQNAGTTGALIAPQVVAAATAQKGLRWQFPRRMYKTPAAVTLFNPSAANAQARNLDSASDCSATATDITGDTAVDVNLTTPAATSAGQRLAVHLTADIQL